MILYKLGGSITEAQAEVTTTTASPVPLDVATVASEGVTQSMPSAAQDAAPEVGRTEEDMARGSPRVVAVVERTSGGLPSALVPGGSRSPARDESPLKASRPLIGFR